jgi:hypothetical protein
MRNWCRFDVNFFDDEETTRRQEHQLFRATFHKARKKHKFHFSINLDPESPLHHRHLVVLNSEKESWWIRSWIHDLLSRKLSLRRHHKMVCQQTWNTSYEVTERSSSRAVAFYSNCMFLHDLLCADSQDHRVQLPRRWSSSSNSIMLPASDSMLLRYIQFN